MAKPITVSVPHDLPPAEVKRRLVEALAEARTKHGDLLKDAHETWPTENRMDFSARAMGQSISGSMQIDPTHVHVTVNLPTLLAMFASTVKPKIEEEAQKLLTR
jgi:hypothetical protein